MAVSVSGQPHDVVGTQLFQKRMKFRAVIRILQMAQLMQQHIVAQRFRQSHQIKVQIYVPSGGTAAPIRGIMLDRDFSAAEPET